MAKVLMTIEAPGEPPTPESIRDRYGLADAELDARFGVVAVDPQAGIYTVMVEDAAAAKLSSGGGWTVRGPFSNPRIAPG
jgi:hypothetical protein